MLMMLMMFACAEGDGERAPVSAAGLEWFEVTEPCDNGGGALIALDYEPLLIVVEECNPTCSPLGYGAGWTVGADDIERFYISTHGCSNTARVRGLR